MNDLDRILENQATIMRVLMDVVSSLPSNGKEHRSGVLKMLETASSEAYEHAHRRDGGSDVDEIRPAADANIQVEGESAK